ncbi:MAG: T9SS type A sorting domain-containing protein [Microscillaceae bacterium]|nr:T9SS type A sorting domain-containing protein [Microscillaceae bacterium]
MTVNTKTYTLKFSIGLFICFSLILGNFQWSRAQTDNCAVGAIPLASSDFLNQSFDVPVGFLNSGAGNPSCGAGTPNHDAWTGFVAPQSGNYVIQYTTLSENAIITVYTDNGTACTGLTEISCVNNINTAGTESTIINVNVNKRVYIRISTETALASDMIGWMSVFKGTPLPADLCLSASEIFVGDCDVDFEVGARFFNNEGKGAAACGTYTPNQDGWLTFTADFTGKAGIEYANLEDDAALEIYSGDCGNLTLVPASCTDDITGIGIEVKEFDVTLNTQYFIRIINKGDGGGMRGSFCLYQVKGRDDITDPTLTPSINLGDCNVKFNVLESFTSTTYPVGASCATTTTDDDAWMVYQAPWVGTMNVVVEYSASLGTPLMRVFEDPMDINNLDPDTDLATQVKEDGSSEGACVTSVAFPSVNMVISMTGGSIYYIQVINPDISNPMLGNLCMYESLAKAENNFFSAKEYNIDGSNCGEQFNILGNFNPNGESHLTADISCATNPIQKDAWARFATGATVNNNIIVEYNNDNNDPLLANDVSVVIYDGGSSNTITPNVSADFCSNAVEVDLNQPTQVDVPFSYTENASDPDPRVGFGTDILCGAGLDTEDDAWVYFVSDGNPFTVVYESNTNQDPSFELFEGTNCSTIQPILGAGIPNCTNQSPSPSVLEYYPTPVVPAIGSRVYIRIVNETGTGDLGGTLTVFTLTQMECINLVTEQEGTETIEISKNDLDPNHVYFVRIGNTSSQSTTTGSLCVREDVILQGDICNTAIPTLVGDCDVNFDLPTSFSINQQGVNPSCLPLNFRDGWMRFTATATQTTIQYQTEDPINTDPAIAVYRGACGASLILIGCENSLDETDVSPTGKAIPETFKFNTVEGLEYFIQIIDRNNFGGGMAGKYCIYNTTERDICDDNDLVTKVVGDCNIPLDVPSSFDNSGDDPTFPAWRDYNASSQLTAGGFIRVNRGCDPDVNATGAADVDSPFDVVNGNSRDSWMRFIGNGQEITMTYQNKEANSNPGLIVYTAIAGPGPINCDASGLNGVGNILNQLACSDTANATAGISQEGIQTEVVTFQSEAGRVYLLRIMDIDRGAVDDLGMTGILCIADGSQRYNTCAEAREIEVGQCSVPINIIDEVNNCSGDTDADLVATGCLVGPEIMLIGRQTNGWKYNDNLVQTYPPNDTEGDNWKSVDFDDSGWATGQGAFGFGESAGVLNTTLFDNNNLTYYFRRTFTAAPGDYSVLKVKLRRDDGAVVYINGVQVILSNLPSTFNATTRASTGISNSAETNYTTYQLTASTLGLIAGADANVVAVELHNRNANDSDIQFDIEITGVDNDLNTCTGSKADAWATFTVPLQCDPDIHPATGTLTYAGSGPYTADCGAPNLKANPGPNGSFAPGSRTDDFCECATYTLKELPDTKITVQYDNRNFTLDEAADVSLTVFKADSCGAISSSAVPSPLVGCIDELGTGEEGIEQITIDNVNFGLTYYIRFINQDTVKTSLGTACILWGTTLAQDECPPANDYGALNGEFKNFEVLGAWDDDNNLPTSTVPGSDPDISDDHPVPCVLPGGSNPASNSPDPIRSQAWIKFTVPTGFKTDENTTAVTVQYDNSGFTSGNPQNAALAVYFMPNDPTGTDGNCAAYNDAIPYNDSDLTQPNIDGLQILGCINAVFDGTESLTVVVGEDTTYFVRVMNVNAGSGTAANMPGRIRIFPFAPCLVDQNLIVHGQFENWPRIQDDTTNASATFNKLQVGASSGSAKSYANSTLATGSDQDYDTYMNNWVHSNPKATGTDRTGFIEDYARFATDYGYLRDQVNVSGGSNNNNVKNQYQYLFAKRDELNPEGLYAVSQSPWSYKGDWYCYGQGYSGYGGSLGGSGHYPSGPNASYCDTGNPNAYAAEDEPCIPVSLPGGVFTIGSFNSIETAKPALIPPFADANFMIVNGSYNPSDNLPPGKVWCQTIDRGASVGKVTYYSFSVWVQNMISYSRNLDVPLLRMTVCDMEDPNVRDDLPALGDDGTVTDINGAPTRLPGVTQFQTTGETFHNPEPPSDYNFEHALLYGRQEPYGAAMPCNLEGENRDTRLKVLGQSFLITENPDRWQLIRCIYRAPAQVVNLNVCLENLSLTKNGNDFGIDNIQFQECNNSDLNAEQFEQLLKGDPCELSTDPVQQDLNAPLRVQMLDFTGKLIGEEVYLNWLVLSEVNVKSYEVQKSLNGQDFYPIGQVDAKGNITSLTEYQYADNKIPDNLRFLYYRLKMISLDGTGQLGPVVRIPIGGEDFDMKIIPNPVQAGGQVEVRFNVPTGTVSLDLYNVMGVRLANQVLDVIQGENSAFIQTDDLSKGIYLVTLRYQDAYGQLKKVTKRVAILK